MMRGFFFSMDAILAFIIALLFIGAIFTAISAIPNLSDEYGNLRKITDDSLLVLDKGGYFGKSIQTNSSKPISEFAKILPRNICYRISISKPLAIAPIIAKENCMCASFAIGRRSIISSTGDGPEEYLAEMRSCIK